MNKKCSVLLLNLAIFLPFYGIYIFFTKIILSRTKPLEPKFYQFLNLPVIFIFINYKVLYVLVLTVLNF